MTFPVVETEFHVDRLRWERDELHGQLSVACGLAGALTIDGWLSGLGSFNLSSPTARKQRATVIAERARAKADWGGMLEELCLRVLKSERAGSPALLLRDVPRPPLDSDLDVDGFRLPRPPHAACIFADGATGKSTMATWILGRLEQQGERVAFFDWELDQYAHRLGLERLFGQNMPGVWYVRCDQPLVQLVDSLQAMIRQRQITYAVFDSVGYACAGAPEAAEHAMAYARAVRQLGVGSLHLAHVRQGDGNDQKPFGSAFWFNSFRSVWFAKRAENASDPSRLSLGFFNRKNNIGRPHSAIGFELDFAEDRTYVSRCDVADVKDLADGLPLWQRVKTAVRSGPLTLVALAEELGAPVNSIEKAVKRRSSVFTRVSGPDGIARVALLETRAA